MARNDSSLMACVMQHICHDKEEFISKHHTSRKFEPCKSAAAPQTDKPPRAEDVTSCCVLGDLRRIPQCTQRLGRLEFSTTHTVLINVQIFNREGGIVPQPGRDVWMGNFVKMPCSPSNIIYKHSSSKSRWSMISKRLKRLVEKKTVNARDVETAILKYNPKYRGQWSFDALTAFVEFGRNEELDTSALFQKMAALALKLPDYVMKSIPLLQQGRAASITLSQVQISCLLANAFFCTFPHRNSSSFPSEYHSYPTINFTRLFSQSSKRKMEKLKAILHYFQVVTDEKVKLDGLVTFERRCLADADVHMWKCCKEKMNKLFVSSCGTIETEGSGMLQVDFASSWLGGGVLDSGLLQEEILFLMNPELIVSRLFTEKLQHKECVIVTGDHFAKLELIPSGCQRFGTYSGFGDTFKWRGPYEDLTGRDSWARRHRQILAIDALNFKHRRDQYNMGAVTRELNKAYCGFRRHREESDIATGKWGCGAFNGDPQLKAVIQLMAAARAKRGLAFFTFKDEALECGLKRSYTLLRMKGATVEDLYSLLVDYCDAQQTPDTASVELFDFIKHRYLCSERPSKSLL